MTEVMKGNLSMIELDAIKQYLNSVTHEMNRRNHVKKNGVDKAPKGNIVSSNTMFSKKFRTHGCGYNR